MNKTLVQEQFGKTAAHYLTSKPHAHGKSLERLVELTAARRKTGACSTSPPAAAMSPIPSRRMSARVWATDITQEMLDQVKGEAAKARPRQSPHHLRQGRGAAVRGRELRSRHLPHRAASLRFDPAIPRRGASRAQARRRSRAGRQCRARRQRRRLHQCLRAPARPEPSARLDHGGMARRAEARAASPSATKSRSTRQMEFKSWAAALRRHHEGAVARDADAGRRPR